MPIEFLKVGKCNTNSKHMLAIVIPKDIYAQRILFRIIMLTN